MDRLQKKCFIASATFHSALLLIFLFGSAMMSREEKTDFKQITLFNAESISSDATGGGGPMTPPAQATPTPPKLQATPTPPDPRPVVKPVDPTPKKEITPPKPVAQRQEPKPPVKQKPDKTKPADDLFATPVKPNLRNKPKVDPNDLVPAKRGTVKPTPQNNDEAIAEANARRAQRDAQRQFASAFQKINQNLSSATQVEMSPGYGTTGALSVNYNDLIRSKYDNAWSTPANVSENAPVVYVTVTVSRSGQIVNARITKRSGIPALDRSVQNALDTVTFIEAFPPSFKENERTVTIQFNLEAKRQTG